MNLVDFLSSPWAILPDRLLEMQAIYSTHLRGDKIDIAAIEARLGRPLASEQQEYVLRDGGVAVLVVSGVISPKANMFTRISGGASAQLVMQQIDGMAADPRVRGVVLDWDTPGGSVFGIPALAESIRALAALKPVVSVSTGMMASAGYWAGSAANAIYISGVTDYVGSIGVVATHTYDPRSGGATTEITAGKYKRMASDNGPLTQEGAAYLQSQVDEIYRVFVDAVAAHRNVDAQDVLANMADGRIFIGQQAIDAGLVDGVATVDALVDAMVSNPDQFATRRTAVFAAVAVPMPEANSSAAGAAALQQPQAINPHVLAAPAASVPIEPQKGVCMTPQEAAAQFAAEHPEAAAVLREAGASGERVRIGAVREQAMPGHEQLIEALAFDGKTTGPEAAVQVLAAERARTAAHAQARAADAPRPVATESAEQADAAAAAAATVAAKADGAIPSGEKAAGLDAAAKAYMAKTPGATYIQAIKAVQQGV